MTRIARTLIATGILFAWYLNPLGAQTARDTVHKATCDDRMAQALRTEALRNNVRKGTVRAIADTLTRCGSALVAPVITPPPPPPNQPPIARIATSCDNTTRSCTANGTASSDDQGITSASIAWGDGANSPSLTATHSYATSGSYTIRLTVRDAAGLSDDTTAVVTLLASQPPPPPTDTVIAGDSTSIATPAELPRNVPSFTVPAATRTYTITGDLQRAIDTAKAGDELRLSGTFAGTYVLPSRSCGSWITIRSVAEPPAPGTRVTPTSAASFAKIVSSGSAAAIKTTNPTCGWRLLGVDVSCPVTAASENYGCIWLGDGGWVGGGENQVSLAQVPQDIVLDRVYLHGTATASLRRCLYLNAGRAIVRDSWLSDCHSQGGDSQAILGCNGPGPYLIENNYLEGGHENVMFGGCDPASPDLIPSDITLRRNHIAKPLGWKGRWTVKNLIETKNVRRMLIEGNVLEHSWQSGQAGMAVVFKSSTETCAACTWEGTKDVTMRWNRIDGAHRGLNLQAIDASSAGTTASHTERVTVTDNLWSNIGRENSIEPLDGWLMLLTHDLKDIRIARNTFVGNAPGYGLAMYLAYGGGGQRLDIADNILAGQSYYAIASDNGLHTQAFVNAYGTAWRFAGNVVSQVEGQFAALSPPGNTYLTSIAQIGLTSDYRATNYPAKGVDIPTLASKTAGVVVAP